ncbi:hypothetical protein [Yinghuangia seranimata]|uniref:hypothetical protein n=1 Tax=Yinghuangia seranimata TaxID=408067 RepID=UPI00248CBCE6|nr:hypothetical protein [Yinghuangia seranimata]MDI2126779.1 hypothetical protein [Yinghuangia seranimata]
MSTGNETDERDPYAPPPEGAPDRPPAAPWNLPGSGGSGSDGQGGGPWGDPRSGRDQRPDRDRDRDRDRERRDDERTPVDPRKRNARIAVWLGVWGLVIAVTVREEIGLVMGIAATVLGVRSLRGTSPARVGPRIEQGPGGTARTPGRARRLARPARVETPPTASVQGTIARPQGALAGLVAGALTVVFVLGVWGFRTWQSDYYDCMDAALTNTAEKQCKQELPSMFRSLVDEVDNKYV